MDAPPRLNRAQPLLTLLPWLLAVGVGLYAWLGPSGWRDAERLHREHERLAGRLTELEAENDRLRQQVERLRADPAYLERQARDRLGMVRPDELVILAPRGETVR